MGYEDAKRVVDYLTGWTQDARMMREKLRNCLQEEVVVHVFRDKTGAKVPVRATKGSSGYDVFAAEPITLAAGEWKLIPTGLYFIIPDGYEFQVRSKSGLSLKWAVTVLNSPGTIDSDYTGELGIIVMNGGSAYHEFEVGAKIAQIVCCKVYEVEFNDVPKEAFDEYAKVKAERGAGGFGSTGT